MSYLDQVTNFIVENTKGATIGQESGPRVDEFGTGRYQPGDEAASARPPTKKILPQESYLTLAQAKFEPVVKKISSISATMISTGRKDYALNPTEEATLKRLSENLNKFIPSTPGIVPGTSSAPASDSLSVSEHDLDLVLKLVRQWPDNDRLPGLDLLRCLATSPAAAGFTDPSGGSVIDIALRAAFHPDEGRIVENCAMMAFRVVANLFTTEQGRQVAYQNAEKVVDYMECLVGTSDTVFQGPVGFPGNRNVLMAVTTAALNYSVLGYLVSKKKVQVVGDATPEAFGLLGNVLCKILKEQNDSEVNYRALVSLGTIASAGHADVLKAVGADSAIKEASKAGEDRIKQIAEECLVLLR